jgi:simple sugar transport system substrate-binding protein
MFRSGKRALAAALVAGLALAGTACTSEGGRQAESGGDAAGAGQADTPRMTFAMITHAPPGDTFFDIIRKGADAAANKDNVEYEYSADPDPAQQATLIQNAIDRQVEGIAVAIPNPAALGPAIKRAADAGIPVVAFNAGFGAWQDTGALMYFGQDESLAGQAAGERLTQEGAEKVLCVIQEQGQVQLEARCAGVKQGFTGGTTENLNVRGTSLPDVRSTIGAKLRQDPSITHVLTLGAPIALTSVDAVQDAGSSAKVVTFDTNPDLVKSIQAGDVLWAVDQQPYLQGYFAIDALWLHKTNGNIVGGGQEVLTGPSFIDESNIEQVAEFAARGTR